MNIQDQEISFIIQGKFNPDVYLTTYQNIKKIFPRSEVIISTYKGTDLSSFDFDLCVLSEDPGFFYYSDTVDSKINNINRQILTTINGLSVATRKYAFKLRSDFTITDKSFINFFNQYPIINKQYSVFEKKILACVFFTRNPFKGDIPLAFHPSDLAFFGLRTDLVNLFEIPLMPIEEENFFTHNNIKVCRYLPEQYLWINCLIKNNKTINFNNQLDCNKFNAEQSILFLVSNFVLLDFNQFNLIPNSKFFLLGENDFSNIITHIEWKKFYFKSFGIKTIIQEFDYMRVNINIKIMMVKIIRIIVKILTFYIPNRNIRKKSRTSLNKSLLKFISFCISRKSI